ncbi:MAG: hypothetical protein V1862_08800 [Methanobacteriota archaeon]
MGDFGSSIAGMVLAYSPWDIGRMRGNCYDKIRSYCAECCKTLEETITTHLDGTFQNVRLLN